MAQFIKLYEENPNPKEISKIVETLQKGGLIIYPTDTVYGLGCDITNNKAMEKLALIKGVKLAKTNFSFVCNDLSHLSNYTKQIDSQTYKLLKKLLPGPYTFILKANNKLKGALKKRTTVGIRVPDNNIIRNIVKELGNPIASTSIHDDDEIIEYTTDPELIFEKWQKHVDIVIDGGYGDNVASTVVDITENTPKILREGKGEFII